MLQESRKQMGGGLAKLNKPNTILAMNLEFTESRNFTFGIGSSWIQCKISAHLWLAAGIELLLFLYMATPISEVTKFYARFQKFIMGSIRKQGKIKTLTPKIDHFTQLLKRIQKEGQLAKKLNKICELVNLFPQIHQTITQGLNSMLADRRKLTQLNFLLGVEIVWNRFPKKLVFNNIYQCELRFTKTGEVELKLEQFLTQQTINKENKRLVRKSTVRSEGEISENDSNYSQVEGRQQQFAKSPELMEFGKQCVQDLRGASQSSMKENNSRTRETEACTDESQCRYAYQNHKFTVSRQYEISVKTQKLQRNASTLIMNSNKLLKIDQKKILFEGRIKKDGESQVHQQRVVRFKYFSPINSQKTRNP